MFNKELLKRIASIEEFLGIKYIPPTVELGEEYAEHVVGEYGFIKRVNKVLEKIEETNGKK